MCGTGHSAMGDRALPRLKAWARQDTVLKHHTLQRGASPGPPFKGGNPRAITVSWTAWPVALSVVAACHGAPVEPCPSPRVAGIAAEQAAPVARPSPFDSAFAAAGTEFDVPPALLKAIGWVETRWQMVQGAEEFPGRALVFGVMALRGAALERGAALAGVPVERARRDPVSNIRAAAALLNAYATETRIDRSRPEQWAALATRLSGIELPEGRAAYAREVDRALG